MLALPPLRKLSKKSARGAKSCWWTTKTARTKATSPWRRKKSRPRPSTSWPRTAAASICLALTEERCDDLALPLMTPVNTSNYGTAFSESIDARRGTTTGISTADRAITILTAIDAATRPTDLARPGHVFPLRARNGGVLVRAGQTEASVDLARIAGLTPAGVICEIMNDDGTMARLPQLAEFCRAHGLKLLTVAELIRYRMRKSATSGASPNRSADALRRFPHDRVRLRRGPRAAHRPRSWNSPAGRRSCACIRTASPAMCLRPPNAIATKLSSARSKPLSARIAACSSTCTTRGEALASTPLRRLGALPRILYHSREQLDMDLARQRLLQHESGIGAQILIDLGLKNPRAHQSPAKGRRPRRLRPHHRRTSPAQNRLAEKTHASNDVTTSARP